MGCARGARRQYDHAIGDRRSAIVKSAGPHINCSDMSDIGGPSQPPKLKSHGRIRSSALFIVFLLILLFTPRMYSGRFGSASAMSSWNLPAWGTLQAGKGCCPGGPYTLYMGTFGWNDRGGRSNWRADAGKLF